MEFSTVRLRAREGVPMDDPVVRDTVVASAHAIAERTGMVLHQVTVEPDAVVVSLATDKIAAMGFAAELRRLTEAWHIKKFGETLWGQVDEEL